MRVRIKRGFGVTAGIWTIGCAIVGLGILNNHEAEMPQSVPQDCIVRVGEVDDATWDLLMEHGWQGDPTDSMEALHNPGC